MSEAPSYHDLHITTPTIPRTSIFNLPFRTRVTCSRAVGWTAYAVAEGDSPGMYLGGEYDYDAKTGEGQWLVLDVAGHVICDSRPKQGKD